MMSHSQIEDSYKHPRHRRFPSERFQEEEPVQTGKFEVNHICSFGLKRKVQRTLFTDHQAKLFLWL